MLLGVITGKCFRLIIGNLSGTGCTSAAARDPYTPENSRQCDNAGTSNTARLQSAGGYQEGAGIIASPFGIQKIFCTRASLHCNPPATEPDDLL